VPGQDWGSRRLAVTMRDVATHAGASPNTVSNVVNGYRYIREATRVRVLASIDALGYQMNISARNLTSGRTGIIGLAVPELSLPYFAELADAVINAAEEHGLTVMIEQTGAVRERELTALAHSRIHRRALVSRARNPRDDSTTLTTGPTS
jgi:DNA-binding LacI/PurR family transcriptional regulator